MGRGGGEFNDPSAPLPPPGVPLASIEDRFFVLACEVHASTQFGTQIEEATHTDQFALGFFVGFACEHRVA